MWHPHADSCKSLTNEATPGLCLRTVACCHHPDAQPSASWNPHLQHVLVVHHPVELLGVGLEAAKPAAVHVSADEGDARAVRLGHGLAYNTNTMAAGEGKRVLIK